MEQRRIGTVGDHRGHLPAEVHRVLQTKVQARPTKWRMDMRRIASMSCLGLVFLGAAIAVSETAISKIAAII